jgi:hypothetical protein
MSDSQSLGREGLSCGAVRRIIAWTQIAGPCNARRAEDVMHSHDNDLESPGRRAETHAPTDQQATDLAGRAAASRRVGALDASAVMHLQASAGNASVSGLLAEDGAERVKGVVGGGGGDRLDPGVQRDMEHRFGQKFDDVRVHRDARASDSARAVNANAYTVGSQVVFRGDRYDPGSDSGKHTIAHELAHVVQQRSGPVEGSPAGGGLRVSHPADRFEQAAEHAADAVMASAGAAGAPPSPAHVQREGEEEEEEVQGSFVQREGEEEEEEVQGSFVQREGEEEEEEVQG